MFPFVVVVVVVVVVVCILMCDPQNYLNIPEPVDYVTISGVQEEELSVPQYNRLLGGKEGPNKVLLEAIVSCMTGQFEPRPSIFSDAVLGCPVDLADFVLTNNGQGLGRRPGGIGPGLLVPRRPITVFPPKEPSVKLEGVEEDQEEPPAAVMKESPKEGVVEEVKEVAKEVVAGRSKKRTRESKRESAKASSKVKALAKKAKKESATKKAEMKALKVKDNAKESSDEESQEEVVEIIREDGEIG